MPSDYRPPSDRIRPRRLLPNEEVDAAMLHTTIPAGPIQRGQPNLPEGWAEHITPIGERYWVDGRLVTDVDPRSTSIVHVHAAYLELSALHNLPQDYIEVYIGFDGEVTLYYLVDHSQRLVMSSEDTPDTWPVFQYWIHVGYFPNHQPLDLEAEEEIIGILSLGIAVEVFSAQEAANTVALLIGLRLQANPVSNPYRVSSFARIWSRWSAHEAAAQGRRAVIDPVAVVPPLHWPQLNSFIQDPWSAITQTLLYLAAMAEIVATHINSAEGAWACLPFILSIMCAYAAYTSDRFTFTKLTPLAAACIVWIIFGRSRRLGIDLANLALLTILLNHLVDEFFDPDPGPGHRFTHWVAMGLSIVLSLVLRFTLKIGPNDPDGQEF